MTISSPSTAAQNVASHYGFIAKIKTAAAQGDLAAVREEVKLHIADPRFLGVWEEAVADAARHGHVEIMRELLPLCKKRATYDTLVHAAGRGNLEVVETLLPFSPSKSSRSKALSRALLRNQVEVARLLIPVVDVDEVGNDLIKSHRWSCLDQLAALSSLAQQGHWLNQAPEGVLPNTQAIWLSHQRANQIADVPTPSLKRLRPRS